MLKFELQKAADKLVREIFEVKAGETVVITADTMSDESLVNAVAAGVHSLGAFPMTIQIATPGSVGKAADPEIPVDALTGALLGADVWIEFNHQWLLYSTPFERAMEKNQKLRYMCLVDFSPELLIRTVGEVDTKPLQVFMEAFGPVSYTHLDVYKRQLSPVTKLPAWKNPWRSLPWPLPPAPADPPATRCPLQWSHILSAPCR